MPLVRYTDYCLDREATPVAHYQRAVLDPVCQYEQSLDGFDEGWDDQLLDDPFEFAQRLDEWNEIPGCLISQVDERLVVLDKAGLYVSFSDAASILHISEDELRKDVEDGHIPMTDDSTISVEMLKSLLVSNIGW